MEPSTPSTADSPVTSKDASTSVVTKNDTMNSVWITIYRRIAGTFHKEDWGCVDPKSSRTWRAGNYDPGDVVKVQGEVKNDAGCGGDTVFTTDTTQKIGYDSTFTLEQGTGNYYWDFSG